MGMGCNLLGRNGAKISAGQKTGGITEAYAVFLTVSLLSEYSQTLLGEKTPLTMTDLGKLSLPRLKALPALLPNFEPRST